MSGSREDFLRNNIFSLIDLYDHALAQESLPWGHEIYNFGRPSLININTIHLVCLNHAPV